MLNEKFYERMGSVNLVTTGKMWVFKVNYMLLKIPKNRITFVKFL